MSEILLFNQYYSSRKELPEVILAGMPINLLCLAAYLKEKGINSKIYELGIFNSKNAILEGRRFRCGISDEEITKIISDESPKIIGLSCMYSVHYIDIVSIARLIKKINPQIKVVLGGNHASIFYESILKEQSFDFVVIGEGEITFFELCEAILWNRNDFENIRGLCFRENRNIIINKMRDLIKNLDELPNLDYSFLDVEKYVNSSPKSPYIMRFPIMGIITSRGCPGRCVFCTVKSVWGQGWRGKSAKKTVDEIEMLHKKYGIKEFSFLDDSASLNKKRWNDICDEIINRKLNIRWTTPNGIAHWTLDRPLLKKMKKSGCYRVTFGIESGNVETRRFIGKTYPLQQAKEMIRYANKIGMWTICTNIIGFPYETKEMMYDTIKFAQESGTDFATFYLLAPHPTSSVYAYFEKDGLLNFADVFKDSEFNAEEYEKMYKILSDTGFSTKYLSSEELKKMQLQAYRSFIIFRAFSYMLLLPLIRKIHSLEDFGYTLRLLLNGFKILLKSLFKTMATTQNLLYQRNIPLTNSLNENVYQAA